MTETEQLWKLGSLHLCLSSVVYYDPALTCSISSTAPHWGNAYEQRQGHVGHSLTQILAIIWGITRVEAGEDTNIVTVILDTTSASVSPFSICKVEGSRIVLSSMVCCDDYRN